MITHQLNFEPLRQWQPKSLPELIEVSDENLIYENVIADMSSFQIDEKGTLNGEGLNLRFSEKGFLQLCKFLKIPNPFANFITWDLLMDNINRIARNIIDKEVVLYFYENSNGDLVCVNVTSTRKVPVHHSLLVQPLAALDYDIDRIVLEDNFLSVFITHPESSHIKPIEVKEGDAIKAGMRLMNSTTGYCYTEAREMYWRLVCSNGLIMPVAEGRIRMKLKRTQDPAAKIDAFLTAVNASLSNMNTHPDFESLLDETLNSVEFARWWKSVKRIIGDAEYVDDYIFQVDEDSRKNWISQSRLVAKEMEEPVETTVNAWQFMNNITEKAQTFTPEVMTKLEEVAGKFLTKTEA